MTRMLGLSMGPYVLFYDKYLQFYRATREADLLALKNKKQIDNNLSMVGAGTDRSCASQNTFRTNNSTNMISSGRERLQIRKKEVSISQSLEHFVDNFISAPSKTTFKDEMNEHVVVPTMGEPPTNDQVLEILYDNYYDCILLLYP